MSIQSLNDYLHSLLSDHNTDETESFIQVGADEMPEIYLSAINEQPDDVNPDKWIEPDGDTDLNGDLEDSEDLPDDSPDLLDSVRPALDVIFQERQAVILGNPGSGKTTLLRYVLHVIAQKFMIDSLNEDVPLYIPLKELNQSNTLASLLNEYIHDREFSDLFERGRVFLFLDGLNEVLPALYEQTVHTIQQFLHSYPNCGLIVTSRLYGYYGQLEISSFILQGFTDENIRDYIQKRTGSDKLFKLVNGHINLHELARNPLMLNMFVSIWLTCGKLPEIKLHLYEQFISYQLQKTGVVSKEDRQTVIDCLSRLAFTMRSYGYLSDSYSGIDSMVAEWVRPERVGEVTLMLVSSGLISVTRKSSDFWCFSFIHETFQEYFSTLYIYRDYFAKGTLCVDLSLPEWGETLMLLSESLSLNADAGRLAAFMGQVAFQFSKGSQTSFFNDNMDDMFDILSTCSSRCNLLRDWLSQYLLFNISNFIELPNEYRTMSRFDTLLSCTAALDSSAIVSIFFRSYRWLQFWLYDIETVDKLGGLILTAPIRVMCRYLNRFSDRVAVFNWLLQVNKEFSCFESIARRINHLLMNLFNCMDKDECRRLYISNGDMDALLRTDDLDFIERETAGKNNLVFPNLVKVMSLVETDSISYFYDTLFDRMCEESRIAMLSSDILADFIIRQPGLDEKLLSDPRLANYRQFILSSCYVVPAEYLSKYYFDKLPLWRENLHLYKNAPLISVWYKAPSGLSYVQLESPTFRDQNSDEFVKLKQLCPDAVLRKMQLNKFYILGEYTEPMPSYVQMLDLDYTCGQEVIPVRNDKEMILLYAHKTDIKRKGDKQYGIFMDGIYYKMQLTKKISVPMVLTSCLTDSIIDSFVQREYNKGVFIPNYYLFRPELLLPWQIQNASTLSQKGQARLGVVGLCLTPGTCLPEKLAIVKHVDKYKVVIQTRDKPSINRFPIRFISLRSGDIVYKFRSGIYKVTNPQIINELAMVEGRVASKNGNNLFISIEGNKYSKDYYYYDKQNFYNVGDRVRFFPVLNSGFNFSGNPLASFVSKIE